MEKTGSRTDTTAQLLPAGDGQRAKLKRRPQISLKPGRPVYSRDHEIYPAAIISTGVAGLLHQLDDGRRSIACLFLKGDILDFHLTANVSGKLVALSPLRLSLIEASCFDPSGHNGHAIGNLLIRCLQNTRDILIRHSIDLARKSAIEKLASYILEISTRSGQQDGKPVCLMLKRIDIADYLGLRPETLCRAFATLRQSGLIRFTGNEHVLIHDKLALQKVAAGGS